MSIKQNNQYPGFEYPAAELSAYLLSTVINMFSISLKSGSTIHYYPADVEGFKKWLDEHKIKNIKADGWMSKGRQNTG